MNHPLSNSQMRDIEALLHPYANSVTLRETGAQVIAKGAGVHVYDDAGKPYLEGMAGLWCCGLGFGNEELVDAATEQMRALPYYHLFSGKSHEPAVELAEKIKELAPGNMARVIYQSSGSEANETQIKLAWYYNNALGRPSRRPRSSSSPRAYPAPPTMSTARRTVSIIASADTVLRDRTNEVWSSVAANVRSSEAETIALMVSLATA